MSPVGGRVLDGLLDTIVCVHGAVHNLLGLTQLDCAGAEFELLEQLLADGTLAELESVHIVWNAALRPELGHLPGVWRNVFRTLGVRVEAGYPTSIRRVQRPSGAPAARSQGPANR